MPTPSLRLTLPSLALTAALAACVPVPEPAPPMENACGAAGLQGLIGQHSRVVQSMSFAGPVRVIGPGMPVTMDFNPTRLNVETDARSIITRVTCG